MSDECTYYVCRMDVYIFQEIVLILAFFSVSLTSDYLVLSSFLINKRLLSKIILRKIPALWEEKQ